MVERGATDREVADHVADEGIAPGIPQHRLGLAEQLRRQLARPPSPPAAGPGRGQACHGPLSDEVPLELGQRSEDVKDQLLLAVVVSMALLQKFAGFAGCVVWLRHSSKSLLDRDLLKLRSMQ